MTPPGDYESEQPQLPKLRMRKDAEPLVTAPPPDTPGRTPEEASRQVAEAKQTLGAWGDIEPLPLPAQQVMYVAIGMLVALALAVGIAPRAAIVSLLIALMLTACLGRLAGVVMAWQVPRRFAPWVACGVVVILLGVVILVWGPVWQTQATQYGSLLTALAGELSGVAERHTASESSQLPVRVAHILEFWINSAAKKAMSSPGAIFFQIALFIGALTTIGVIRSAEPTGGMAKTWGAITGLVVNLFAKSGFVISSRVAKAAVVAVVAGIGLQLAGVTAPWFLAGCVLVFAIIFRTVPLLTVILAAPMIPWTGAWIKGAGIVAGTGVAMYFVEKQLHWYVYKRPALAAGMILPDVHGGEARGGGLGTIFGGAIMTVRIVIALACVGLIGGLLWVFVPTFQERGARQRDVQQGVTLAENNSPQATDELLKLAEKYPNEADVLLGLTKAYALAGNTSNAMHYAELYASWEPKPVEPKTPREKWYQRLMGYFPTEPPSFNRAAGYEFILKQYREQETPIDARRDLAAKVITLNPDSLTALNVLANEYMMRNEPDQAAEYAQRGVKLDPHGPGWHPILADIYLMKKDWTRVIAECDAQLALFPDDERIASLRKLALRAQEQEKKLK